LVGLPIRCWDGVASASSSSKGLVMMCDFVFSASCLSFGFFYFRGSGGRGG
jgi:hypothetical protein